MERLSIIEAKSLGNLCIELKFSDETVQCVDIGSYILHRPHPQYNKYLEEDEFNKFVIDGGNVVWGEDWDLIFPIEQLHAGKIEY